MQNKPANNSVTVPVGMVNTKVCAEVLHSPYQPQLKACLDPGAAWQEPIAALINPLEPSDNIGAKTVSWFINMDGAARFITASSQAENFALQ